MSMSYSRLTTNLFDDLLFLMEKCNLQLACTSQNLARLLVDHPQVLTVLALQSIGFNKLYISYYE
jgi:hypothetical protein